MLISEQHLLKRFTHQHVADARLYGVVGQDHSVVSLPASSLNMEFQKLRLKIEQHKPSEP